MPFRPQRAPLPDTFAALHQLEHVGQHELDIADDRNIDLDVLGNRRGVDIHMDDRLGFGRKVGEPPGDPIVEARSHGDQAIGVGDRGVGAIRTVHPEHPEAERVRSRKRSQPHQRFAKRDSQAAHELGQLGRGARPLHAAADVKQRALAFLDRLDSRARSGADYP